jgi:DNA-directed RNA polymerase subunit omega
MARITVEDCEDVVANRFDLVILAVQRARQIIGGEPITLEDNDEKKPVIALREIAARSVPVDMLREKAIRDFRTNISEEDMDENIEDMLAEDTYKPSVVVDVAALESGSFSVTEEDDENNPVS